MAQISRGSINTKARTRSLGRQRVGGINNPASLTTALSGSNNDLVFTAKDTSLDGNNITVQYIDPAANSQSLYVRTDGQVIKVYLATNGGGTITSTAAQVKAAIEGHGLANALVSVANAASNDGTGVVTALAATSLSGALVAGRDITVNSATDGSAVATSTSAQVKAAIEASAAASALVTVAHATGNDGTGTVAALSYTAFTGGLSITSGK